MKQITLLTIGSRGDVQPFVALGKRLRLAGYDVKVATHQLFEPFITSNGLRFAPIAGDPRDFSRMLTSEKAGADMLTFARQLSRWASSFMDDALHDCEVALDDADMLICGFLGIAALCVAERNRIPAVFAPSFPLYQITSAYPPVTSPLPDTGIGWINRLLHRFEYAGGYTMRPTLNRWRTESLGLPSYSWSQPFPFGTINGQPLTKLFAYSTHLLPRPDDYPPHTHVTGYWFLDHDENWNPPTGLRDFLDAGEPPIYAGFGSLIDNNPEQLVETILKATRATGNRLILLGGWADYQVKPADDVFVVSEVPHDWLFPRVKAVIHHGGAGTTAAGLRAGVPSVITPFFGDQHFWGQLLHKQDLSPKAIPVRRLTADNLAAAITEATSNPAMRERAAELGAKIALEDGVTTAMELVELYLSKQYS